MGDTPSELKRIAADMRGVLARNFSMENGGWGLYDSGLVTGKDSYDDDFSKLYPERYANLKDYIEKTYPNRKGKAVGTELGGPGSRLFSDFTRNFFMRSAGIVLEDKRTPAQKEKDSLIHHEVVVADIFGTKGNNKIRSWLGGQKADLIFERMEGGSADLPEDPKFLWISLNRRYDLLTDKGMILAQTPYIKENSNFDKIDDWLTAFRNEYYNEFDIEWVWQGHRLYLKLRKKDKAPLKLPH